jgi:hypothetical protein
MRVARTVLIVLVVLGGLFVAADRILVSVAENKAAQQAKVTEGLSSKPDVSIKGFPFLTQVVSGKLDDVKIKAKGLAADGGTGQEVRFESLNADLHGVKLSNGFSRAVADSADGQVFVTYEDLQNAIGVPGLRVSYGGPAKDGTALVKLAGPIMGAQLSVLSKVTVHGGDTISLTAQDLPTAFTALGLEHRVRQQIDVVVHISHLPSGLSLTGVGSAPEGITVTAAGKDVVLAN